MALTKATYSMIAGATVNVQDYGAVADWNGSTGTDNTTAFAAAVSALAAQGGGTLLFPPGDYKGHLVINQSNIKCLGYGANIGFLPAETLTIEPLLGASNYGPFLAFAPASNVPIDPAAGAVFYDVTNATQGSQTVTVSNSSGIEVGDYCMMISGTFALSTPSTNYIPETCQIRKVYAVDGNDVIFDEVNDATVTSGSEHPYLIKWDYIDNIRIEGLTFNNFYGAAYSVSMGGVYGIEFEQVTFEPNSAWGAFSSCRKVTFNNCTIRGNGYGFSNGRMCDELAFLNCSVSSVLQSGSTAQYFFLFTEENPKRIVIDGCTGINAALQFYGGGGWTDINISNSKFDVFEENVSAFRLTTYLDGSHINVVNSTFVSRGGNYTNPWDDAPYGTIEIAYTSASSLIVFNGCSIVQAGTGIEVGLNHGSSYDNVQFIVPIFNETGTWTPTLQGSSTAGTTTYTLQKGAYNRIGDRVFLDFQIGWSATTAAGNFYVTGLPFGTPVGNPVIVCTVYDQTFTAYGSSIAANSNTLVTLKGVASSGSLIGTISFNI